VRRKALAVYLSFVAILWQFAAHAKDQPPASPLQFVESTSTTIVFSWEQLKTGTAIVSVFNPSAEQDVSLQATDFNQPGREKAFDVVVVPIMSKN